MTRAMAIVAWVSGVVAWLALVMFWKVLFAFAGLLCATALLVWGFQVQSDSQADRSAR